MIPFSKPHIGEKELEYVSKAVTSTWLSDGEYVEQFEKNFSKTIGINYASSTSNGTSAIQLAFQAMGILSGSDVIFPSFCFQAGAHIALQLGIRPVFVDSKPVNLYVDIEDIKNKLTENTKAIFVVHNYGYPADLDPIVDLCNENNLFLIEDCAEAFMSGYGKKLCGTIGHAATFSFHATKTITTGEGGMLVTDNPTLAENARILKSHGLKFRGTYNHLAPGNNYRMSNIAAAMGCAQLESVNEIVTKKRLLYNTYRGILYDKDGVHVYSEMEDTHPLLWSFPVELYKSRFTQGRDAVVKQLAGMGIETRPGFISANNLPYFRCEETFPNSNFLSESILVLPMYTDLTIDEVEFICSSLLDLRSR